MSYPKTPIGRHRNREHDLKPLRFSSERLLTTLKGPCAVLSASALLLLLVGLSVVSPSRAQSPPATNTVESPDEELAEIQSRADSVGEHIASITSQEVVITRALSASKTRIEQIRIEVAGLRARIEEQKARYENLQQKAEAIATELYKAGPTAELEPFLEADSIAELSQASEYLGESAQLNSVAMIRPARLKETLQQDQLTLESRLREAQEARFELATRAQHLQELRKAKQTDLAKLERQINGLQQEVDALAAPSAAIASQLDSGSAPAANVGGFAWPFGGAVTSGYGYRWGRMHQGIDIDCDSGDAIRASKSGTVVTATYDDGYGNHLIVDHGGGYASLYAHNTTLAVSVGQQVAQGQVISSCGATGNVTGDHLHFEIRVNGAPQDPLAYLP